jgi:hypothetical protein
MVMSLMGNLGTLFHTLHKSLKMGCCPKPRFILFHAKKNETNKIRPNDCFLTGCFRPVR